MDIWIASGMGRSSVSRGSFPGRVIRATSTGSLLPMCQAASPSVRPVECWHRVKAYWSQSPYHLQPVRLACSFSGGQSIPILLPGHVKDYILFITHKEGVPTFLPLASMLGVKMSEPLLKKLWQKLLLQAADNTCVLLCQRLGLFVRDRFREDMEKRVIGVWQHQHPLVAKIDFNAVDWLGTAFTVLLA